MAVVQRRECAPETGLIEAARVLAPRIAACADEIEREQRLPQPIFEAMAEAGLFRMMLPRELGGYEVDPLTYMRVVEEVSRADGSAGWLTVIGAGSAFAASLPLDVSRTIWGHDPYAFMAGGGGGRRGRAQVVDGGYRVTGSFGFGSGCRHATWLLGGCHIVDGDTPVLGPNGIPEARWVAFAASDCRVIDSWHVTGLVGTGSHDYETVDTFVPEEWTVPLSYYRPPRLGGQIYAFAGGYVARPEQASALANPVAGLVPTGYGAVALGIARGALDAFVDIGGAKAPRGGQALLRDSPIVQDQFGQAEALLRSGRAFLFETTREIWETVGRTGASTDDQQTLLRMAGAHATAVAAQAVDIVWKLAAASAIFAGNPLERRFRDIHVATQNVALSHTQYATMGRRLLGA